MDSSVTIVPASSVTPSERTKVGVPGGEPRTLVLCFDGTSNEYDEDVSGYQPISVMVLTMPSFRTRTSSSSLPS
jgi:uncharacterized protein (DUF2235 family)